MKVFSLNINNPQSKQVSKTYTVRKSTINTITKPYGIDTVSFGRVAENAEKMRKLFKYGMIDIHTGQRIIDPEWFKESLQKGLFEKSLQTVVKTIKPMEDCLHKVEAELFKKLEAISAEHPLYRLSDAIGILAPKAQEHLLNLQKPIFTQLKELGKKLPSEQKAAFDKLMYTTEQQLENKPILYNFSKKEFKYQLERIGQGIKRRGIQDEIKTINKLMNMSDRLPYLPSGRNFKRRNLKFDANKSIAQANVIRQLDNYFTRSVLKNDQELQVLFTNAKKQAFNIPTVIPFKVKTFSHELQSITDSIKDEKLAREMMKTASKLPTAQEELSAFIMKSSRNSSTKIGYDLLNGSVGAIDHLIPYSHGGADSLENYAFTTNAINSKRGDRTIEKWLQKNPATYDGSQKCVDRLLELYRSGVLAQEEFTPWYMIHFANRIKKLSPKTKPLIVDLGTLPQELHAKNF